ncbi:hypothetical protein [Brevundimonas sp. NPDC046655]|uniref:hypothetical protein n=1 Tax=unclassified Brevundimonas TaxID=2622653 RepID=UPI00384C9FD7
MARDNFPEPVKRELAMRAAYFCSNPFCLRLTAGPRSVSSRGLKTGHAAHICAASPGFARYDSNQTEAERRSADNGLWLCRECGDIVDKDEAGYPVQTLKTWKHTHDTMIAEIRQKGWAESLELLRAGRLEPDVAEQVVALVEDRRVFWARFDAEFPDRVRQSLDNLRHDLTDLRRQCRAGGPLDVMIVALGQTIRHFFDSVERLDLVMLRCDSGNPDWVDFEQALKALRKSIGIQVVALADAFAIPLQGEFAQYVAPD